MNNPADLPKIPAARVSPDALRPGSPLEVSESLRDRLCLLDNGTLCVASGHRADNDVLEYIDLLRRLRAGVFNIEYVAPEVIAEVYRNARHHGGSESDSFRQRRMMEIIRDGVAEGASDIHITNTSASSVVEFRIDGLLYKYRGRDKEQGEHRITGTDGQLLCGALMQGMAHTGGGGNYDMNTPQDARLRQDVASVCGLQGARIATRPMQSAGGNTLVMRLFYERAVQTLESLGFDPEQAKMLREFVYRRKGVLLVSGPTGGGKTTTLYSIADEIIKDSGNKINLMTIEDPIEAKLHNCRQTQLVYSANDGPDAVKRAWLASIKNCVRLDPDVLMVGEIRDRESAVAAIDLAMTGHGLLGTVHTEFVTQILDRLREMGVDKSLLADPYIMRTLVNQSLAPKNCPRCAQPYTRVKKRVPEDVQQRIEQWCPDPTKVFMQGRDKQCPECKGRGVKGRIPIAEVLLTTADLLNVWAKEGGAKMRRAWIESGGASKSVVLSRAVARGLIDPILGEKEIGCLMSDDRR